MERDLEHFYIVLNAEVPEFKDLLSNQPLYDASISLVVPISMSNHF